MGELDNAWSSSCTSPISSHFNLEKTVAGNVSLGLVEPMLRQEERAVCFLGLERTNRTC